MEKKLPSPYEHLPPMCTSPLCTLYPQWTHHPYEHLTPMNIPPMKAQPLCIPPYELHLPMNTKPHGIPSPLWTPPPYEYQTPWNTISSQTTLPRHILQEAIALRDLQSVKLLLAAGADVNIPVKVNSYFKVKSRKPISTLLS